MNENNQNENSQSESNLDNNQVVEEPQVINNPFANMSREKNEMAEQKKKNKITIIVASIVVGFLLIYIFIDFIGDSINKNPAKPEAKENLKEVALELQTFIIDNNLDSLDAYGKDELLRVAINNMCFGVYECKIVSADEVHNYIKNVFNKDIELGDVNCELNDGVLYSYNMENNTFVYNENHPKHPAVNVEPVYTKLNSIKKSGDKYVMVLNKLYYSSDRSEYITSDPLGIHKIYDFEDYDMPSANGQVLDVTKVTSDYENDFDKIKNKGTRYQYTFVKDGKKYYLEKYLVLGE
ncbi:MAG: hypothetical protein IKJ43_02190 [Bacilli bacterium]|nr:hypothetical protein [Bacilli bacterium]